MVRSNAQHGLDSELAPTVVSTDTLPVGKFPTATARRSPFRRPGVTPMPAPAAVAPHDRIGFLDALRASELLSPAQLAKARAVAGTGSAEDVAGTLVVAGLLTRFQADRLLSGRTDGFLLGPYVILEQVGRGSMSRVYKAKHRTMHRPVAVKVLSADLTDTPAHREAVREAVRTAGKLAHPNIVTAYDANELHDRFYLVLEFVDGPDLGTLVRARGPLPVAEACEFVRQIATGLEHAHQKGMAHADLKPGNLLVARPTPSAPPTVKIADFGVPKSPHGAGEFAAPELLGPRARPADHRADLYSLGRVFYFLLTGRAGREMLPLVQLRPDVPGEVAGIVHRLLAPNPDDRFGSATELLLHLDAACVPVALPVEGAVNFDLPLPPLPPGRDSGYLTGRQPRVDARAADTSPWAEITAATEADGNTVPQNSDETPTPMPRRARPRPTKAPGHGEPVPLWMTAALLVGIVLMCLMGIGVVVRVLAK
ncbi:MAG: serine/threonine protein kinase [Planctomycetes bacterium]|nr:serine/threonine protein kinase [Planctomycetota bacterium]